MSIGTVFATTGGSKLARCLRSFARMEPDVQPHVVLDTSSNTWKRNQRLDVPPNTPVRHIVNSAHINGVLNAALEWMKELGHTHAALFHDDLIFSPLPEHRYSLSEWFTHPLVQTSSGLRYSHFETFVPEVDSRRASEVWEYEDLESPELWTFLKTFTMCDGVDCRPPGRSFWFKYEGPDKVRKWNRLGPTGQIVPLATWEQVGKFDEVEGIFYDGEYPSECFKRKLPPVYAVTNFPYIHLHNQSMNPWGDPAPNGFGNTGAAYERRYHADWPGFWGGDWEEKWKDEHEDLVSVQCKRS